MADPVLKGTVNTMETLTGLYKQVYADGIEKLIPECSILTKAIPFRESEKLGDKYHQPVLLTGEQGITVAKSNHGSVALNSSVAATMQDAEVTGASYYMRGTMSFEAAAKACGSKQAFAKATELLYTNMVESMTKRLEVTYLYGGVGIGKVLSATLNNGNIDVVLTNDSWTAGIWGGLENTQFDFVDMSPAAVTNPVITTLTLYSVDVDSKKLTFTGTADTTKITGMDIYFKGSYGQEFVGLDAILKNTGTMFNISAAKYALWRSSQYDMKNNPLSIAGILSAVNKAVARGLNEKVTCYINPERFTPLSINEAALRRYGGEKDGSNGFESIKFYSSNGEIEITPHPFVKQGDAFILPIKRIKRVGATDLTFSIPGLGEKMWLVTPDQTSYETRCMVDLSLFCEQPAKCVKINGIGDYTPTINPYRG